MPSSDTNQNGRTKGDGAGRGGGPTHALAGPASTHTAAAIKLLTYGYERIPPQQKMQKQPACGFPPFVQSVNSERALEADIRFCEGTWDSVYKVGTLSVNWDSQRGP